jgi:hypothetical protein
MALEHGERRRWCDEISSINRRFNEQGPSLLDVT